MSGAPAVLAEDVRKSFGEVPALDGIDLRVEAGTVFGLLGPNGAGKTTLVRILATLVEPTSGHARVFGFDVVADPLAVRRRIGLAGQFAAVDEELTGRENVEMIGRLFRLSAAEARTRAGAILERFNLTDAADRPVSTYSGGMRRRLDLCASLTGHPPLILLDEPTTGLDPRSRQELWNTVDALRQEGTTVLLTTQYLEEADRLAQRIAIIDRGRITAEGTATELKATVGSSILSVRLADARQTAAAAAHLAALGADGDEPQVDHAGGVVRLAVTDPAVSAEAVRRLDDEKLAIHSVELQQPSLDDVFLSLTGRRADDASATDRRSAEAA